MARLFTVMLGLLVASSVSFAQDRGGWRDPRDSRGGRGDDRGSDIRGGGWGRDDRGGRGDDRGGRGDDRGGRDDRGGGPREDRTRYSSSQDFGGATGPGDMCQTCALENRADVPRGSGKNRFLLNNDGDSVDARCRELGFDWGQTLQVYSYQEWCKYGNARTRTYDTRARRWSFGSCTDGNVKAARCFKR